jgi:hypothetical protein
VTPSKINWSLSPVERELLRRDCEASKVPITVKDPDAIKKVVGLITKAGDRLPPPESLEPPQHAEGAPAENGTATDHSNVNSNLIKQYCNATLPWSEVANCIRSAERYAGPEAEIHQQWIESLRRVL